MSRKKKKKVILVRNEYAPVLSEETLRRITAIGMLARPGLNELGIFHEQFCADALGAGAKKCVCTPDVRFIKGMKDGKSVELPNQN